MGLHNTANTIRLSGLKKAGTEKAKKIEEGTILEAIIFLFGVSELMESLGLKPSKNEPETEETVVSDTAVTEEVEEAVEVDTAYSRTLRNRKVENVVEDSE